MTHLSKPLKGLFLALFVATFAHAEDAPLSLVETLTLAKISDDPSVEIYRSKAGMLKDMSIAAGQLPDPKVRFGVSNLALNSFSLTQEPMTSLQIGVHQSFTSSSKRNLAGREVLERSKASLYSAENRELLIEREIKQLYMQLVHADKIARLITLKKKTIAAIATSLEIRLGNSKGQLSTIIDLQTEIALLEDKLEEVQQNRERLQSYLARYIGEENAKRILAGDYEDVGAPKPIEGIESDIQAHPALMIDKALIKAEEHSINLAKEDYKPDWGVDLGYAQRGAGRANMATAMVTMNVPLFTDKRQDKKLSAAKQSKQAAVLGQRSKELEMIKAAKANFAVWVKSSERIGLYKKVILARAKAASQANENAFTAGRGDFTTFIRSHLSELNARLKLEDIKLQRTNAAINLTYYSAISKGADQ